jgi:hypothetical protein
MHCHWRGPDAVAWLISTFMPSACIQGQIRANTGSVGHRGPPICELYIIKWQVLGEGLNPWRPMLTIFFVLFSTEVVIPTSSPSKARNPAEKGVCGSPGTINIRSLTRKSVLSGGSNPSRVKTHGRYCWICLFFTALFVFIP